SSARASPARRRGTTRQCSTIRPGASCASSAVILVRARSCRFSWSSLQAQRPDWLRSGFIRLLVQEHDNGHPEINKLGVPLAVEFAKTAENRRVMELIYSSETFG